MLFVIRTFYFSYLFFLSLFVFVKGIQSPVLVVFFFVFRDVNSSLKSGKYFYCQYLLV